MPDMLQLRSGFRSRTKCNYLDYYVNDVRLADTLRIGDFIPPLGWLSPEIDLHFRMMLLRKEPSDFKPDRVPLFVCPECVDYGCGVGTVRITREGDAIVWSDFRWERDYDDEIHQSDNEKRLRFSFDAGEYFRALNETKQANRVPGSD